MRFYEYAAYSMRVVEQWSMAISVQPHLSTQAANTHTHPHTTEINKIRN